MTVTDFYAIGVGSVSLTPGSSTAPGCLPSRVPIRRAGREIQPDAHVVREWVRAVPELEQERGEAVACWSPSALHPGVEGFA